MNDNYIDEKIEELKIKLEKYLESCNKNPKFSLYHYTNFAGLTGILQTRRLWLTDFKCLNDPSEIEHGKNIILDYLTKNLENNEDLRFNYIRFINNVIEQNFKVYITAFCTKGDYLPAWRYYGDNGAGFSIGFKKAHFIPLDDVPPRDAVNMYEIQYNSKKFGKIVLDILGIADEVFPEWKKGKYVNIKYYLSALLSSLLAVIPMTKNKDFKDEKEWRYCMIRIYDKKTNTWWPAELPTERVVISRPNYPYIAPFIKNLKTTVCHIESYQFDFSDIETIFVGPRLDFLSAKLAIEKLLYDYGIDKNVFKTISIQKSIRPYK